MSNQRTASGDSGLEVSDPLRLTSNSPSPHGPITAKMPALERHVSRIPQDSDDDGYDDDEEAQDDKNGLKGKLKKLKNHMTHHPSSSSRHNNPSPKSHPDERHDSAHAASDLEVTPGLTISSGDHTDYRSSSSSGLRTPPRREGQLSSSAHDHSTTTTAVHDKPLPGHSPRLERHISGIPLDDYDSDREGALHGKR